MSIITLITDFGYKDHFVAKIKGQIYKKSSDIVDKVNIVDISHEVSPFNIMEAAYILQSSFNNFPNGTIHIIDVDSEKNIENSHIVMIFDPVTTEVIKIKKIGTILIKSRNKNFLSL